MPHDLDETDGQTSFVSAVEDAWHALGTTLDSTFTAEQAMEFGKLGKWNVRKLPLYTVTEDGRTLPVPGRYATVRDNPIRKGQIDVLGDVGEGYTIIQNEYNCELLNQLVDQSGAHFETAGALDGGRKVFVSMKLPSHMMIGGVDRVDTYIAAVNSHDGSSAYTVMVTPVRPVCRNTLNLAFQLARGIYRVRHTSGAKRLMEQEARNALGMTFKYLDKFQAEAEEMIQKTLTQQRFEQIIAKEFGAPENAAPATVTRCDNKLDEMARLFADASTQAGIRNTAWAGLNAMTEWFDHLAPVRGDDRETQRATRALMDPGFKTKALELMKAV